MKTKNITITVPVITNPLPKLNNIRKDCVRAFLNGKMQAEYAKGNFAAAFETYHKIKSI